MQNSFRRLKEPILAYADYWKPFHLHIDASEPGLGAVILQTQNDGTDRIVTYASRTLNNLERRYVDHKLRF